MARFSFTKKEEQYIKKWVGIKSNPEISYALGRPRSSVCQYLRFRGLSISKETMQAIRTANLIKRHIKIRPTEYDEYLKENYLLVGIKPMAAAIGRSDTFVRSQLRYLGLVIPPDITERNRKAGQIKCGNVPANKGQKLSEEVKKKMAHTFYKKGHLPHNTKPEGQDFSIRHHKDGHHYLYYRKSIGKWVLWQREVWERANGPVPKGHVVRFIDGDNTNFDISNLGLLTLAENLELNSDRRLPPDLKRLKQIINQLRLKIKEKS